LVDRHDNISSRQESEARMASELFGISEPPKRMSAEDAYDDDEESSAAAKARAKKEKEQGTVLEKLSFQTVADGEAAGALIAALVREKTPKRDNVLMAFMKEILRVGVDTLKIDDVNAMKDHMTTLYNAKKSAKAAGKGATAAGGKGTASGPASVILYLL
jgi:hypothetical protein